MSTDICRWLFLLFVLTTWVDLSNSKEIRVVCYYTNWSVYRPGAAKFSPQNINPYLCTHLIYAFGGFTKENTLKPFDKYQDLEKGGYAKFTGLKTYNKNLKTMLAIGGWNEGSSRFSPMVANPDRRKELVKNAVKFLRQNHFDGLDLDWEYPAFRDGGKSRDRDNYAALVQELREEFDRESEKTGRTRLLLTMAVPAGIEYINKGYDVPRLTKYLDWMNILSYDYHSAFEPAVNHHAPLYSLEEDSEYNYDAELNIDYTIQHYLKMGADPSKLVMGIPTYGRSYTLFNPDANDLGAPADGPGDMGDATRENGYLAYYEICENVKSQDWEVVQASPNAMGPFAFKDNQWVGYDDDNIARKKAEYVAEKGLGGIMFWSIDNDDFRGNCHGKPYPIIEAAKEALISAYGLSDENAISPSRKPLKPKTRTRGRVTAKTSDNEVASKPATKKPSSGAARRRNRLKAKSSEDTSSTKPNLRRKDSSRRSTTEAPVYSSLELVTPSYTTPAPPSTPDTGGVFKCEDEGFYSHPKDCKKYFWCLSGPGELGIIAHQFTCPAGLYFNKAADSCDYTRNVICNKKPETKSTTTTTSSTTEKSTTTAKAHTTHHTSRPIFRTSTTTESNFEEEYEYEDDELPEAERNAEEDPRVIKELLDLIKKAGGIEELEKQLKIQEGQSTPGGTTPSTIISKSLVERVLNKAGRSSFIGKKNTYTTINRNSRGPQNQGLEKEEEEVKQNNGRPQYTTIARHRSKSNDQDDEDSDKDSDAKESPQKSPNRNKQYVNIQRGRSSANQEEDTPNYKSQVNRNKILGEEDEEDDAKEDEDSEDEVDATTKKASSPQYVNIRRHRPSTTEESATSKYTVIRRGTTTEAAEEDDNASKPKIRRGSSTPSAQEISEDAKTRSTTTASSTVDDLKSKYQTIKRGSTTESVSTNATTTTAASSATTTSAQPSTATQASKEPLQTTVTDSPPTTLSSLSPSTPESLSEKTVASSLSSEKRTSTPALFEPRPFSLSTRPPSTAKPVTEPSTKVTKVSEAHSRGPTEKPAPFRTRAPSRFRPNLNAIQDQEGEARPSTVNPSLRARKRFSTTTERGGGGDVDYEINRAFRPVDIGDFSSLTAVDFTRDQGYNEGGYRKRKPRPQGPSSTTTEASEEEGLKTGSRTLPLARKYLSGAQFGKNKRIAPSAVEDQVNSSSDVTISQRARGSARRSPDLEQPTTESSRPSLRTRKIIRRFRPTTAPTLATAESSSGFHARRRSTTIRAATEEASVKAVTTNPLLLHRRFTRPARTSAATEESAEEVSGEEDENIKLSESNIRENNDVSSVNVIGEDAKVRRKLLKRIKSKEEEEEKRVTEPNIIIRTRKIVRKLRPTEATILTTTEKAVVDPTVNTTHGVRRKIIRRLRPSTELPESQEVKQLNKDSAHPLNKFDSEDEEAPKTFRRYKSFAKTTITSLSEENLSKTKYSTVDRGTTGTTTNTPTADDEELTEENVEVTTAVMPPEEKPTEKPRKYRILRPKIQANASEEDQAVEKKERILQPYSRNYTSKSTEESVGFETTNSSFAEEELNMTTPVEPAISEEINLNATSSAELEGNATASEEAEIAANTTVLDESGTEFNTTEASANATLETSSERELPNYKNPILDRQKNRPAFKRPKLTTQSPARSSTSATVGSRARGFRGRQRQSTTARAEEAERRFSPRTPNRGRYSNLRRTSTSTTEASLVDDTLEEVNVTGVTNETEVAEEAANVTKTKNETEAIEVQVSKGTNETEAENTTELDLTTQFLNFSTTERGEDELGFITTRLSTEASTEEADATTVPYVTSNVTYSAEEGETSTLNYIESSSTSSRNETEEFYNTTTEEALNTTEASVSATSANATEAAVRTTTEASNATTAAFQTRSSLRPIEARPKLGLFGRAKPTPFASSTVAPTTASGKKKFSFKPRTTPSLRLSTAEEAKEDEEVEGEAVKDEATLVEAVEQAIKDEAAITEHEQGQAEAETDGERSKEEEVEEKTPSTSKPLTTKSKPKFGFRPKSTTSRSKTDIDESLPEDEAEEKEEGPIRHRPLFTPKPHKFNKPFTTPRSEAGEEPSKPRFILRPKAVNSPIAGQDEEEEIKKNLRKASNRPNSFSTEAPKTTEGLSGIDTESVKNRNKNLFSKNRKMNTPSSPAVSSEASGSQVLSTTPVIAESVTKPSTVGLETTTDSLTTLLHVFAETEAATENATVGNATEIATSTKASKVERLIEVNRIIEVHAKSDDMKKTKSVTNKTELHEDGKVVDKIGAINRVTNIKVVNGDAEENEISSTDQAASSSTATTSTTTTEIPQQLFATVKEISKESYGFPQLSQRQDRKFEIYGGSKVLDYNGKGGLDYYGYGKSVTIFDGKSHINIITPRPFYSTEASTIALEGLFQTDTPQKLNDLTVGSLHSTPAQDEEVLETGNSRYVNVRVLEPEKTTAASAVSLEDYITMRARVVEIVPKHKDETIRIAPIRVEMSRKLLHPEDFSTRVESGVRKVELKVVSNAPSQ